MLARRFLRILEANRARAWTDGDVACPPGYLVAVTFTRKAAEEMRGRIAKRIGDRIRDARETGDGSAFAYWTEMRRALDDSTITTLDGLAHKIVLDHALLIGIDPDSAVLDTVETRILIDETVDEVLADPPAEAREDVQRLFVTTSPHSVRHLLAALLQDRGFAHRWATEALARDDDAFLRHLERWAAPCTPEEARTALDAIARCLERHSGPAPKAGKATDFLDLCMSAVDARSGDDDACLRALVGLIPRLTKSDGTLYTKASSLVGNQGDWKPTGDPKLGQGLYDQVAAAVSSYVSGCLDAVGRADQDLLVLMRGLARTYLDAEARYAEKKRRRSALDYADLQHHALRVLQYPGVAAEVRARIRHLLVDEFQDTNETQWRLVQLLAADPWEADHAPWEDEASEDPESAFVSAAELFGDDLTADDVAEAAPAQPPEVPVIDTTIHGDIEISEPHGDSDVPLGDDRLFIVGDAKQSIYGFRGADVSVYQASRAALKAANRAHGTDHAPLSGLLLADGEAEPLHDDEPVGEIRLDKNFRSLPNLVTFANELFDELLRPMHAATYAPYEAAPGPLRPHRPALAGDDPGQVHLLVTPAEPAGYATTAHPQREALAALDPHEAACLRIAQHIADHLHGPDALRVEDETVPPDDPDRFRVATPSDIAILLPRRTHLKTLERALASEGIRYVIAGGRGYWQRQEVWDQVNLLAFLADPYRDVALAGLLRSPFFAWTDDAVVRLALDDGPGPLWRRLERTAKGEGTWAPPDGFSGAPPDEVHRILAGALAAAGAMPTHRVLQDVQEETAYLAALSSEEQPEQAVANVDKFLREIREREARSGVHLARLLRDIEHLIDSDTDEAEAELPEDAEGVRIMTIHAAKGLEFPIVYLPDLARTFRSGGVGEAAAFRRGTIDGIPLLSTKTLHHEDGEPVDPVLHQLLGREEKKQAVAEAARLFYVAVTRARDHLVMQAPSPRLFPKKEGTDVPPRHEAKSCLDWLEAVLGLGPEDYAEIFATEARRVTRHLGTARYQIDLTPPRVAARPPVPPGTSAVAAPTPVLSLPEVARPLSPLLVHPSALETFRACPARFRYRHLDGLPDLRARGVEFQAAARGPLLGALVHRILESTRDDEAIPPKLIARVRSIALEHGHDADAMERDVVAHVQKARLGLAAEGRPIKELVFEHAWADGIRTRGAIDRLVPHEDSWIVLDTKSDRPADAAGHGASAGYDAQVTLYREAVWSLAGGEVTGALVYTSTGERIEVAPDAAVSHLRKRLVSTRALEASRREQEMSALWPATPEPRDLCDGCGFQRRYGGPCAGASP